ncbi:unnamed protein product [Blepharisma stoltei]|uniref:Uncharacterized protein n=1 Tax=Blepharisma stoltei TaxID=1481888 RepID=A0AAU9K6L1_9CILI|nr:unnamed protein product [Blepharisma stoltei]
MEDEVRRNHRNSDCIEDFDFDEEEIEGEEKGGFSIDHLAKIVKNMLYPALFLYASTSLGPKIGSWAAKRMGYIVNSKLV